MEASGESVPNDIALSQPVFDFKIVAKKMVYPFLLIDYMHRECQEVVEVGVIGEHDKLPTEQVMTPSTNSFYNDAKLVL